MIEFIMAVSHLKVTFVDVVKCRIAIVENISFLFAVVDLNILTDLIWIY